MKCTNLIVDQIKVNKAKKIFYKNMKRIGYVEVVVGELEFFLIIIIAIYY